MSRTWFTSDTHFLHPKVAELRGFAGVAEHDEELVRRWNAAVRPDDQVWHLGDVGMGEQDRLLEIVDRLNGTLHLVAGNHDPVWGGQRHAHRHQATWMRHFASVHDHARRRMLGTDVLLSHFPYYGDHTEHDRHSEFRLRDTGKPLLHGHVHAEWQVRGRQINVGVDVWDLQPVGIDTVVALVHDVLATQDPADADNFQAFVTDIVDEYAHACPHCPPENGAQEWVVGLDDVYRIVDRVHSGVGIERRVSA